MNACFYERLMSHAIALNLGLKATDLRLLPQAIPLPASDEELFRLLDVIPSEAPVLDVAPNRPCFSTTYGALLQSQPDSYMVSVAKENYANPDYWLPQGSNGEGQKTPIYTPSTAAISRFLGRGSALNFTFDSSASQPPVGGLSPWPNLMGDQVFPISGRVAESGPFVLRMLIDKFALLPIRPGAWSSMAVLIHAYLHEGTDWLTGPGTISWEELFGERGVLKYVCNRMLVISGIHLELQSSGQYGGDVFQALKEKESKSVLPYCSNVTNFSQEYAIDPRGNITVTIQLPSTETLLFLVEARSIVELIEQM